ncbi:MAG: DUF4396 domain-containing protein [Chloroflexi bacterium]|nr:MAG: DUF4396 domain-containing protein [Chloroflexota bacterium]
MSSSSAPRNEGNRDARHRCARSYSRPRLRGLRASRRNRATTHCLTGCAIGEVLGLVISTAFGWSNRPSIAIAVVLAFFFGYSLTLWPLLRAGVAFGAAIGVAFASDTFSIVLMEIIDNAIVLAVPGAMGAGLDEALFWGSLAFALAVAFLPAVGLNYFLIRRGWGHAKIHQYHH